jgi:hypothetical protein
MVCGVREILAGWWGRIGGHVFNMDYAVWTYETLDEGADECNDIADVCCSSHTNISPQ